MSARKKIRKLSRQYPNADGVKKILDSLGENANDRATAIMGVALMEGALEKILQANLRRSDPSFVISLFENRGPLSDFYSKILIACAFGIINKVQAEELQMLNAIRNAFAHTTSEITFDTEEIAEAVKELKIRQVTESTANEFTDKMVMSNKKWFLLVVKILFVVYESIYKNKTGSSLVAD